MKKISKVLILIVIINFMGIMMNSSALGNSQITRINDPKEKDRLEIIKEKGAITVASSLNEIPFISIDPKTKEIRGIDAEIIDEIARRLQVNKVEFKEIPFSNLLEKLSTDDNIDMAASGIYITPEREKLVAFTKPLYKETEIIIVPRFSKIASVNDLKNAVVGVEKGTIFKDLAQKWKENNLIKDVVVFENTSSLFNELNDGKIDAGLSDSVVVNYFLLKDKKLLLRTLKDYMPELPGNIGIAVKKSDVSLLNELNKIIDSMKADGTLYAILVDNGLDKNNMV